MANHRVLVSADVARCCGVERDAELPAYAWPGGDPLFYLAQEYGEEFIICPACANLPEQRAGLTAVGIHWEGDPLECETCGALVESAYGPLEEEVS